MVDILQPSELHNLFSHHSSHHHHEFSYDEERFEFLDKMKPSSVPTQLPTPPSTASPPPSHLLTSTNHDRMNKTSTTATEDTSATPPPSSLQALLANPITFVPSSTKDTTNALSTSNHKQEFLECIKCCTVFFTEAALDEHENFACDKATSSSKLSRPRLPTDRIIASAEAPQPTKVKIEIPEEVEVNVDTPKMEQPKTETPTAQNDGMQKSVATSSQTDKAMIDNKVSIKEKAAEMALLSKPVASPAATPKRYIPRGFVNNCGNHCYRNAATQAFLSVAPLRVAIVKHKCAGKSDCPACALGNIIKVHTHSPANRGSHDARTDFMRIAKKIGRPFTGRDQEDAVEFLCRMIDRLEEVHPTLKKSINQIFGGAYVQGVKCRSCSHVSKTTHTFPSLVLQFPRKNDKVISLEALLKAFTGTKEYMDEYKCDICRKVGADKILKMSEVPEYALLVPGRHFRSPITGYGTKIKTHVSFPKVLSWSASTFGKDKSATSTLRAVICQSGSLSFGHYTAYVQDPASQQWVCCDDTSVYKVTEADVLRQTEKVYGLIYQRDGVMQTGTGIGKKRKSEGSSEEVEMKKRRQY